MINEENFVSAATDDIVISACTVELDENERMFSTPENMFTAIICA